MGKIQRAAEMHALWEKFEELIAAHPDSLNPLILEVHTEGSGVIYFLKHAINSSFEDEELLVEWSSLDTALGEIEAVAWPELYGELDKAQFDEDW